LSESDIGKAAKTLLVAAGAIWGFRKGLGTAEATEFNGQTPPDVPPAGPARETAKYVTREELHSALAGAQAQFEQELSSRLETHSAAMGSLREMISETDELLSRVLDRLESAGSE
jgi:hypothetical protein